MAGYAATAPVLVAGPWGVAIWIVAGTALTVATVATGVGVYEIYEARSRERSRSDPIAPPIARVRDDCEECRRYGARVHAQGTDCGGRSSSTIGAPGITQSQPVTVAQGLALSAATKALLTRGQLEIRLEVIGQAERWIQTRPTSGYKGTKSFPVRGVRGGIRYDVDTFGDGPSFVR